MHLIHLYLGPVSQHMPSVTCNFLQMSICVKGEIFEPSICSSSSRKLLKTEVASQADGIREEKENVLDTLILF